MLLRLEKDILKSFKKRFSGDRVPPSKTGVYPPPLDGEVKDRTKLFANNFFLFSKVLEHSNDSASATNIK